MTQDELAKKIKLWGSLVIAAFVVLIITLIVQFGFIAHHNREIARLREEIAQKQAQLNAATAEEAFFPTQWEQILIEHGCQPH